MELIKCYNNPDLERFISLFLGYPNSLGINPLTENDAPPISRDRAAKMLRIWNINNVAKYGISTLLINKKLKLPSC
ncbi:unnamed protein product [Rhizophagus irregularis]|nr:unnamed protein product [Rhizophagus irregularis]CAB5380457.1 unnamed protein product [Rhizophagus irregularis]